MLDKRVLIASVPSLSLSLSTSKSLFSESEVSCMEPPWVPSLLQSSHAGNFASWSWSEQSFAKMAVANAPKHFSSFFRSPTPSRSTFFVQATGLKTIDLWWVLVFQLLFKSSSDSSSWFWELTRLMYLKPWLWLLLWLIHGWSPSPWERSCNLFPNFFTSTSLQLFCFWNTKPKPVLLNCN